MPREARERNVIQKYKSVDNNDFELVTMNLKIRKYEKIKLDNLIKKLNMEEKPVTKITIISVVRKAIKLLEKELSKRPFEKI